MSLSKQIPATTLTSADTASSDELGLTRLESNGKEYRYVQVVNLTAKKGDVVVYRTSNNYSTTVSHTLARRNTFAGVAIGTINASRYGWVQIRGYNTYMHTDGGVAAGDALKVASAANACAGDMSNTASVIPIGRSLTADSGSICLVTWIGPT